MIHRLLGLLPVGALPVVGHLGVAACTTYGFLAVSARALGPEGYAPLAVLWSAVFLVVPALWGPLEQETGRLIADRRTRGQGARPVVRAAAIVAATIGVPAAALVVVTAGPSGDALLSGHTGVAVALGAAVLAFAANHLLRAALAGVGAFWAYGACISLDSGARLLGAIVLAMAGVDSPTAFALMVAVAPLAAVATIRPRGSAVEAGPPVNPSLVRRAVVPLIGGQLAAQALINGGPIAVAALATDAEEIVAGQVLAALVIARIPLFFFQAVQSSLLPTLAAHRAAGDRPGFARASARLAAALLALAAVGTVVAAALGPDVVRIAFGAGFALGGGDLAMFALGSGLFMVATVLAHAAIALEGHRGVAIGWVTGVLAAGAALAVASDLRWRVEVALVLGVGVAAMVHGLHATLRWRAWHPAERFVSGSHPRPT